MRVKLSILCWLVLLALPALAGTQALPWAVVQQINASGRIRVLLTDRRRATLHRPRADSMIVSFDHGTFLNRGGSVVELSPPVSSGQIAQIDVANGSHAGGGARIGAGIGAGLALVAVVGCQDSICEPTTSEAVSLVVGWSFVGAGIGAFIGSLSPRWRTIYPPR